jgi:hypothetical protein
MNIVALKKIDDCFDGSMIWELELDEKITEDWILALAVKGRLEYFKDFPRRFFRLFLSDGSQAKGVLDEKSFTFIGNYENETKLKEVINNLAR